MNGIEQRRHARRTVDFPVLVTFPTRGLRDVASATLRMRDISEGGASLHTGGLTGTPDFFYIQFDGENSDLVGCYVVGRTDSLLNCKFMREFDTASLERIIFARAMPEPTREKLVQDILDLL